MTDILIMPDGSRWKPSSSSDTVECVNCDNAVDTPEEIASYPDGKLSRMWRKLDWIGKKKYTNTGNST